MPPDHPIAHSWISPPIGTDPIVLQRMVWLDSRDTLPDGEPRYGHAHAEASVQHVLDRLGEQSNNPHHLVIFLRDALPGAWGIEADPLYWFRVGPAEPRQYAQWLYRVFRGLAEAGLNIAHVVLDDEGGIGRWHLGDPHGFFPKLQRPALAKHLPDYLRSYPWHAYLWSHGGPNVEAIDMWDQFAAETKAEMLRRCVYRPIQLGFGDRVRVTNWWDSGHDRERYPLRNGRWTRASAAVDQASPVAYPSKSSDPDQRWHHFLDGMRAGIANCAVYGRPVIWLTAGRDREIERWTIRLSAAAGVAEFSVFNPGASDADNRAIEQALRESEVGDVADHELIVPEYGDREVRVGDLVVRREDLA